MGTITAVDLEPRELDAGQMELIRRLAHQVMSQLELRHKLVELAEAQEGIASANQALEAEKAKSDELLLNILPAAVAAELKKSDHVAARHDSVTIMFTDFKGFTRLAGTMEPKGLVDQLDQYFTLFDDITGRHGIEKLKTIGDAYMCVGGLPEENRSHPVDVCLAALEIQSTMARMNAQRAKLNLAQWELRIGIHTGSVMAGVVGKRKFTYNIWGDAVNMAAAMEANGEPGRINLSETTYQRIKTFFECEVRGPVEAKNKGPVKAFFLERIKTEFSADSDGQKANDTFARAAAR